MGDRIQYDLKNPRLRKFTDRFRKLTDENGGISAMAGVTGISRPTLTFWYNGERTPDAKKLITLSQTLGISIDYLLGLTGEDNATNDEELRRCSAYTGLSNHAVLSLAQHPDAVRTDTTNLSTVLCRDEFYELISVLEEIQRDYDHLVNSCAIIRMMQEGIPLSDERIKNALGKEFGGKRIKNSEIMEEAVYACKSNREAVRMDQFELMKKWLAFTESLIPTDKAIAEADKLIKKEEGHLSNDNQ